MSLRDQLLKSGLASKKDAHQTSKALRKQRKKAQAQQEKRRVITAREEAQRLAEAQAAAQRSLDERRARTAQREAEERVRQVDNILRYHALHLRFGEQRFWHKSPCGRFALRLDLQQRVAWDLRQGVLAVAWLGRLDAPQDAPQGALQIVLIPRDIADRVAAIDASRVLFHNAQAPSRDDPSLQLYQPSWLGESEAAQQPARARTSD